MIRRRSSARRGSVDVVLFLVGKDKTARIRRDARRDGRSTLRRDTLQVSQADLRSRTSRLGPGAPVSEETRRNDDKEGKSEGSKVGGAKEEGSEGTKTGDEREIVFYG
ncbi:hypothetical protein EYF80_004806 [Liparis tanakae]|uniref:Uncharacterized protein n=1 Tax=Liparis tanakae TaxID=230148 RepID=A0A4Z2J488_9TELE|nr:hypothetical protein EYF80_004806 [Liparis tanakae]